MLSGSKFLYRDCLVGAGVSLHLFFYAAENIQLYTSLFISFILSTVFLLKINAFSSVVNLFQLSINISFLVLLGQWFLSNIPELEPISPVVYYKLGVIFLGYLAISIFSYVISKRDIQDS